jgi:hypothetical protein
LKEGQNKWGKNGDKNGSVCYKTIQPLLQNRTKVVCRIPNFSILSRKPETHGLWPWMNAPTFGRDVAPLGR